MSMDDVEMLLKNSPCSGQNSEINGQCMETWNIALWNNHKLFVSHPYYQDYLWKKICGFDFHWENYYFYWKLFYIFLAILIFFTYPFVVLFDTIFGNNDILFQRESETKEHSLKAFYRRLMHRPIFRIIVHHFLELIFLLTLILSTIDPLDVTGKKEVHFYDYILCIFIGSYLLEDIIDIFRRGWASLSSFWHCYTLFTSFLLCLGQVIVAIVFQKMFAQADDDRSKENGNHPANVGAAIFSVGAIFTLLRPLRWLLFHRSLGPTVVCIIKVLRDAFHVFLIYLIVLGAFSIGIYSMYKPFNLRDQFTHNIVMAQDDLNHTEHQFLMAGEDLNQTEDEDVMAKYDLNQTEHKYVMAEDDLKTVKGLMSAMFWLLFDPGKPEYVAIKKCGGIEGFSCNTTENDRDLQIGQVSMEFSHWMGYAMWACYQGITVILLINILIAMMNTTFSKIWQAADTAWKYSKSFYQVEFLDSRAILPPPFR